LKLATRRLISVIPTLLLITILSFLLLKLIPGDPARTLAGDNATEAQVKVIRHSLGLDKPVIQQYFDYMGNLLHGDLGTSLVNGDSVTHRIGQALPVTASLALFALIFAILIGVPAGVLAALRRGRAADHLVTGASSVLIAIPPFIVASLLVIVFALDRSWLPAGGYVDPSAGIGEWARYLVLPALALSLASAAELARQVRGSLADTMEEDFVRSAHARGLKNRSVIGKHAAKSAAIPVVTVLALQVGRILGGAVIVELIFAMPGFGTLALDSVLSRDVPVVQGIVLVSAIVVIATNLLADLSYGYFNPKIRTSM
jgi:peptide/nickel transport system permease protein